MSKHSSLFRAHFFTSATGLMVNLGQSVTAMSRPVFEAVHKISTVATGTAYDLQFAAEDMFVQFEMQEELNNLSTIDLYDLMEEDEFDLEVELLDQNETVLDRMHYKGCRISEVSSSDLDYAPDDSNDVVTRSISVVFSSCEHFINNPPTLN